MRHRGHLAGLILLATLVVRGYPCGPFSVEMIFVDHQRPDNLKDFVLGSPFILDRQYHVRSLALSYRILNGPALTPAEKKSLLDNYANDTGLPPPANGLHAWETAAQNILGSNAGVPVSNEETHVPGSEWQTYENCQDDAFATAARTLLDRRKRHPAERQAVLEWVHGQEAVFSNCNTASQLPLPSNLPPNSPIWLQQDRAYQLAAAHLYRNEWPAAEFGFAAIASDPASPWHDLADYLVGRTFIRQSTLTGHGSGPIDGFANFDIPSMTLAEAQMKGIAAGHGPYANSAAKLLNFIQLRLDPAQAAVRIGNRIAGPDPNLAQDLIDLRYSFDMNLSRDQILKEQSPSDLVDWITYMTYYNHKPGYAADRWHQTHHLAWLAAALSENGNLAPQPDILAAAAEVPGDSPAWPTLTYLRLAATPSGPDTLQQTLYARETLIAQHAQTSAINQFTALALRQAPSAADFARLAPMDPAGATLYTNEFRALLPGKDPDGRAFERPPATMASLPANVAGVKRFDETTAVLLNHNVPLSTLVPMILDSNWPRQLRFEAAMSTWSRAVLLDQPEQARKLIPILIEGEPGWSQWLNAYAAAQTPDEQNVTGLLAILRFPSVRPFINPGPTRDAGFARYSEYRDNWWCATLDLGHTEAGRTTPRPPPPPLPPFITPELAAEAHQEEEQIVRLGDADALFGKQTLAWVKAHPRDPRNPELLGFAFRAMRNGCNQEDTYSLRRQVYQTLQTRYPNSTWAKHWPTFTYETGGN